MCSRTWARLYPAFSRIFCGEINRLANRRTPAGGLMVSRGETVVHVKNVSCTQPTVFKTVHPLQIQSKRIRNGT